MTKNCLMFMQRERETYRENEKPHILSKTDNPEKIVTLWDNIFTH